MAVGLLQRSGPGGGGRTRPGSTGGFRRFMKARISRLLATCCYIGLIPGAPGTYASVAATLAFFLVYRIHYRIAPELHFSVVCLISAVGVFTSANVSREIGNEDPGIV